MSSELLPKIHLSGSLGLRDADAVKQRLLDSLGQSAPLQIDCGDLVEIDASIIQLMIAAQKSASARGIACTVSMPTDGVLAQALTRGGFLPAAGSNRAAVMSFGVTD